jgi:protein TonB
MKRLLLITAIVVLFTYVVKAKNANTAWSTPAAINHLTLQKLTPPEFPGGEMAFHNYLNKNLKWPDPAIDVQGIVIISFFVEKDGRLTGFKVAKSLQTVFDSEALRVIMKSPKWVPAMKNNKPIKSKYSVPIKFFLNE